MKTLLLVLTLFATAAFAAVVETESTWDRYSGSSKKGAYPTRAECVAAVPVGTTQQCRFRVTVKRTADPVPPPASTWVQCATESGTCTFTGTREVRYGTSPTLTGQYAAKTLASPVGCNNETFGDPAVGLTKTCWYAATTTEPPPPPPPPPPPSTGGIPTPLTIAGKPVVGPIRAVSGQVIENVHVVASTGTCITIEGVSNVVVRNSEIGPCGPETSVTEDMGIRVQNGASNVTIERNVIHNASSGVYVTQATGPFVFDRNYVYNIRGPMPRGQMIQFNGFSGANSRVTCNISDGQPGTRYGVAHGVNQRLEDHINMYGASGTSSSRLEVAYNRIRGYGPGSTTGTGIMVGDNGGSWVWAHDNTIVNSGGGGFAIAGGNNNTHQRNRSFNNQVVEGSIGAYIWEQGGGACTNASMLDNRLWISNGNQFWNAGNCNPSTVTGNNWNDTTLTAAIFDEAFTQCQ